VHRGFKELAHREDFGRFGYIAIRRSAQILAIGGGREQCFD